MNSSGGTGAEVIYALRNNEKLSSKILNELAKEGQTIRKYYQKRGTTNSSKDYYFIHRDTPNTEAVIVEYGFLDTKADADRLKKNYKDYALAVVEAVLDYKGIVPEQTDYYTVKSGDTIFMGNIKINWVYLVYLWYNGSILKIILGGAWWILILF